MGNFERGGNRGGGFRGGDRGGRPDFKKSFGGGRDRGEVTMHKTTCSEGGKSCEVPFRPTGEKPVYCNDCFSSKREGGDREERRPRNDFTERSPRREFNNDRAPRQEFARPQQSGGNDEMKKQLGEISMKIDRLVSVIEKMTQPKAEVVVAKAVAPKAEVKKEVTKAAVKKVEVKAVKKVVTKKIPAVKKVVAKKKK